MAGCSATPLYGGKRRKTRKTRKMRGGVVSGAIGPLSVGAMEYGAVDISAPVDSSTGQAVNDPFKTSGDNNAKVTGGRRRASRRKTKKSKKSKKGGRKSRKMRGGAAGVYNVATAGTSFTGAVSGMPGSQTYGQYTGYNVGNPAGNPHSAGADGVMQLS